MTAKKPNAVQGRPTKRTAEINRKLEEVAALDGSIEEMAMWAGIHRETLRNWLQADPVFSARIEELRERPVLKARQTIVKALEDPKYAVQYLERKRKKEWAGRTEVTGADGAPIQGNVITFVDFSQKPDGTKD